MRFIQSMVPVLCFTAIVGAADTASAAVRVVTSTADSGAGSLRAAVDGAADGDRIVFQLAFPAEIVTATEITIDDDIVLEGPGADLLTVRHDRTSFATTIFEVMGATATIEGMTLRDGQGWFGGALHVVGALVVRRCAIVENDAGSLGGGVFVSGSLEVTDSVIASNTAVDDAGGIMVFPDTDVVVRRSLVVDNASPLVAGLRVDDGATGLVENTTFRDNVAGYADAGAIYFGGATLELTHVTVEGGVARALRVDDGSVVITGSILASSGGAAVMRTSGSLTSGGGNVVSDSISGFSDPTDVVNASALLLPLADNGGFTETAALDPESPAIGIASCLDASGELVTVDQRGFPRPVALGCTAGAYEPSSELLVVATAVDPGLGCDAGGRRIDVGYDFDGDSALTGAEVVDTFLVCDGVTGDEGDTAIVVTTTLGVGEGGCAAGGVRVDYGVDDGTGPSAVAGDGVLGPAELDGTTTICNGVAGASGSNGMNGLPGTGGTNGTDGTDGFPSLVAFGSLEDGICPAGGIAVLTGVDDGAGGATAGDGVLDLGEVDSTAVVCNGAAGASGGGCSVASGADTGSNWAWLVGVIGVLVWRRRR